MKYFNCLYFLLLATLFSPVAGHAQAQLGDSAAGFSLSLPKEWHAREWPGLKYKIAFATPSKGFAPNVVVMDEAFSGTLAEYSKISKKNMPLIMPEGKLLSSNSFVTKSGVTGEKWITTNKNSGKTLRQIMYILPSKGKYITFTLSKLAEQGTQYEKSMDEAIANVKL